MGTDIRRCAMHERATILGALDAALRGASATPSSASDSLKLWHNAAQARFLKDVADQSAYSHLAKSNYQFSYKIERGDGQPLRPEHLLSVVREVNYEVHDVVRSGWSMFHPFMGADIEPFFFFTTDPAIDSGETDFLECSLLRSRQQIIGFPDFWRVAPDGRANIIRF